MFNRIVAFAMAMLLLIGMVPTYEVSAELQQELTCTIDVLSEGGTLEGNTVTFRDIELEYVPANNTTRLQNGWWVGIKVTAPAGLDMEKATYQRQTSTGWSEANLFKTVKDSPDNAPEAYVELWGLVNEQHLNDARVQNKNVHYGYQFDWDGNGIYEDQLHMEVVPTATTLKKDGKVIYPVTTGYATVKTFSGGMSITGNQSNVVTVVQDEVTVLEWVAADATIGRKEDGWWIGIDVIAPAEAELSNVTFQSKKSNGWGEVKSFDQLKDTKNSIQLWKLVNESHLATAVAGKKDLDYQWRFDWNGDGVYEQLVRITVDPDLVVLHDRNGAQIYPKWGSVLPLTGGTVDGDESSLTLTIEETVLEWSPADPDINRMGDGWWVGMLITAPEDYTDEQLKSATYKRRVSNSTAESGWSEYQEVSFAQVRDTQTQVQIWMPLTQELVDKYEGLGKNISMECVFDWNGDRKDDQTITMSVVPSDKIVLNKVEQAPLVFMEPNPVGKWVGDPYTNIAVGGSGDGKVTYSIVSGEDVATVDPETGTLKFYKVGTVEVRAVKAGTSVYKEAVAHYRVDAIRNSQKTFDFENNSAEITVDFDQKTFSNIAKGGSGTGEVTYKSSTESIAVVDEKSGVVTFKKAGQVTISAVKAEDDLYAEITRTYILVIKKSEQQEVTVQAPATISYSTDPQMVIEAGGGSDGAFAYEIVEGGEYASIDAVTGAITTKKAGGSVTVAVSRGGTDGYYPAEAVKVSIHIEKAEQKPLTFKNEKPQNITFNDNDNTFTNVAEGGSGNGGITYSLAEETNAASIDKKSGKLTILAAGTVKVIATKAGDDCYKKQTAEYELTIERDTPQFNVSDLELVFGVEKHQIEVEDVLGGSGKYVFSIGDKNEINASVDKNGEITFDVTTAREGSAIIRITKEEDDQYAALEKTITVKVSYLKTDAKPVVSGNRKNDSGWYTGDITIAAPEGYQIISSDKLSTKAWSDTLSVNTEGTENDCYVHLKNTEGITAPIAVEDLLLDKSCPMELKISYSTSAWERVWETITFGYYNPTETVVTLSAKDTTSGIAYFTYNYDEGKVTADKMTAQQDGTMIYSFTVDSDYRDRISFTAVDVAGWETTLQDDKVLVVDLTEPELTVLYEYTGDTRENKGIIYTNNTVHVQLEIKERNFDLSLLEEKDRPLVKLDNEEIPLEWNRGDNDVWTARFSITQSATHDLDITYSDLSGNEKATYRKTIVLAGDPPVISMQYSGTPVYGNVYDCPTTATLKIHEKNFNPEDVELTVIAKDITGAEVDISAKEYSSKAKDPANWTSDGDVHTLDPQVMVFDIEANYTVDIAYISLTGNAAEEYKPDEFTVDQTHPNNITITYSESVVDKIFNAVTFGFYDAEMVVTVTAEDMTSGVQHVRVEYDRQIIDLQPVQDSDRKNVFTASTKLKPEARGKVTASVQDYAENRTELSDDRILVLDTKVPGLDVKYAFSSEQMREYQGVYYTQGDALVEFTIDEANFDLALMTADGEEKNPAPVVTVNDEARTVTWERIEGTDKWVGETLLSGNGDYAVSISFADRSGNEMEPYTQKVHIDNVAPELVVTYDNNDARNGNCYQADRTATVVITDHNFNPEDVELMITVKDITGADVEISAKEYSSKVKDPANWSSDGDVHTLDTQVMVFDIDGLYTVTLSYKDLAENGPATYSDGFVLDKTQPANIQITYSASVVDKILNAVTFGFYNGEMIVSVTAEDMTSGVQHIWVEYDYQIAELEVVQDGDRKNVFTASTKLKPEARGAVTAYVQDYAENKTQYSDGRILVLDTEVPGLDVKYEFSSEQMREYQGIYYTQSDTTVEFTIDEANFDLTLMTAEDEEANVAPVVTVNDEVRAVTWEQIEGTDKWVGKTLLSGNGDYVVSISFADRSGNEMESYTQEIHIDNVAPVLDVTYDNNEARNENCYQADRTATIVITEHNFNPEEVELTVTAKDITGAEVDISAKKYRDNAKIPGNWSSEGDVHTLNPQCVIFDTDAIYNVTLSYTDLAENGPVTYQEEFVIDKTAPSGITISYSESVIDKIFNAVTFGFYQGDVTVTVTAEDMTAGMEYFQIEYCPVDGRNNSNKASYKSEELQPKQDSDCKNLFTATVNIEPEARGTVTAQAMDRAGNGTLQSDKRVLVLDEKVPGLDVQYGFSSKQMREHQDIYYTQGDTTVTFTVEEANFDLALMTADGEEKNAAPVVTVNGDQREVTWKQIKDTDKWVGKTLLSGEGDYIVNISFADRSGNEMEPYTKEIHIDDTDPVLDVTYDNNEARNESYYQADRTATIVITEHNFNPEEVELTVDAVDITGAVVDLSGKQYGNKAKDPENWSREGDVYTLNPHCMKFDMDAHYVVKLSYTDLAENGPVTYSEDFVIDKTAPEITAIEFSASVAENVNGFYRDYMTVEVTAKDITAGVEYIKIAYTKEENSSDIQTDSFVTPPLQVTQDEDHPNVFHVSYSIPAQARGKLSAEVCDLAGNTAEDAEDKTIVVDNVKPIREVIYSPYKVLDAQSLQEIETYNEGDAFILYYRDKAEVTFKITEANFDLSLVDGVHKPVVKVNDEQIDVDWKRNGDVYTAVYTITGDGDYHISMTYEDLSTNRMVDYFSSKIAIDSQAPVIQTEYKDGKPSQVQKGLKIYPTNQNLLLTVTEHNFRADDIKVTVTARDIQGNLVDVSKFGYEAYAKNRANWSSEGDVHTLDLSGMEFKMDAIYNLDIVYDDILDNYAADYQNDEFVIDHKGPTNFRIEYSESVDTKTKKPLTFGFYQNDVTVTISADDLFAGVDYFDWTYTKREGTSEKNTQTLSGHITADKIVYSNDGLTATATFTIPAQVRGSISLVAVDRAGNSAQMSDSSRVNVVDNIVPVVTVTYEPTEETTATQYVDGTYSTVKSFDQAVNAFYNGKVTATIVIDEANFFEGVAAADGVIHRVGITLTRTDDNGRVTRTEYLPAGAQRQYANAKPQEITWVSDGDIHSAQITFAADGDYVLDIDYTDHSGNEATITANDGKTAERHYTSKTLTLDTTAPVVTVEYGNKNIIHTIDGRDYFAAAQSAVITVKEHNFRPADFAASVSAVNIMGQNIATENFGATLANASNWTTNGNTHTARIYYPVEANYTFDFSLKDLAQNVAAEYEADLFTVDTTAPENLSVSYSTSILEKVLKNVTFGYYNEQVKVTISADDDVAGVLYFVYSYIKSEGVSGVNAQLLDQKLQEANGNIVRNGKTFTTSFMLPVNQLKGDNQFNGTVRFTAYDRSENNTLMEDHYRVVVDNIKPTATVTYNEPAQQVNNVSYYLGDVNAQIKVNEANFYKEDVVVKIDGQPVTVHWIDNSADVHTGTFTITEDGDHVVTVDYKDRSNNEMTTYTSNTLTIDTVAPVVEVSNIKNNSANKDEKYGFTITATDINLDASTFQPVLKATVRNADGTYGIKTVSLGDMNTVEKGEIYTYTVENLPEDAVYTLECSVRDMSGNEYTKILLTDREAYDQVRFSINRQGSTFTADQTTNDLVQQYYIYQVDNDVVLEEINVDPVENYTIRLNDKELVEGEDYTTSVTNRDGEWSKRTYVISRELFEAEGEYTIVVETKDKAQTTSFSDVKNLNVSFVVDRTAPVLTISGLQDGGRYQVDEQKVTVIPMDDGGRLYSMKVTVLDSKGQPLKNGKGEDVSIRFDMSGEEFLSYLNENNGEVTFTIPEGLEHQVVITCNDSAVSAEGATNEYHRTFAKVTVSQSKWIIFYANKPLFYSVVGGVVVALGLLIVLIVFKRRKKATK